MRGGELRTNEESEVKDLRRKGLFETVGFGLTFEVCEFGLNGDVGDGRLDGGVIKLLLLP